MKVVQKMYDGEVWEGYADVESDFGMSIYRSEDEPGHDALGRTKLSGELCVLDDGTHLQFEFYVGGKKRGYRVVLYFSAEDLRNFSNAVSEFENKELWRQITQLKGGLQEGEEETLDDADERSR